jgi:hypothetical protein
VKSGSPSGGASRSEMIGFFYDPYRRGIFIKKTAKLLKFSCFLDDFRVTGI